MNKDKVLCLIKIVNTIIEYDEQELWMDLEYINRNYYIYKEEIIIPLIDHLHSDKENNQTESHYHVDTRYLEKERDYLQYDRINPNKLSDNEKIEYRLLKKHTNVFKGITPVQLISKSKLKHNCIHKGKCPHRGYDLTNVLPDEKGIITCPLHGLKFDINKNLIP